jgi:hypothetical protein
MTLPGILFGVLVSVLMGAVFHLWKDGGFIKLLFFIGLSFLGFWIGHVAGNYSKLYFWSLGQLRLGMGILGSLIFLFAGDWLSHFRTAKSGRS